MGQLLHLQKQRLAYLVKIVLKLSDPKGKKVAEREFIEQLDMDLAQLGRSSSVSRYDGYVCAFGACTFWVYNTDLDQALQEILPLLQHRIFTPGSYYVKVDHAWNIWDVVSLG